MRKMELIAAFVSLMMIASAASALAWGPNDPTDQKADPDGDKLGNLDEFRAGTNPLNPDSDGGGAWDGWEVLYGLDPTDARDELWDTDNDGWSNFREFLEGTNPLDPNTDDDQYQLDSTDPHPLVPDGFNPYREGEGVPPGDHPIIDPDLNRPIPGPVPQPGPTPNPPPDDGDQDHDGLVEFLETL